MSRLRWTLLAALVAAGCGVAPAPQGADDDGPVRAGGPAGAPGARPLRLREESSRPGTSRDDPIRRPRDLSGRSVKTARVRVLASTDPALAGTSAYFVRRDPWLAYARGRELTLREFTRADGVFGESGKLDGPRLDDGATHMMNRDHTSGCAVCHNSPWRDMGAGANIAKNGGAGRNTPHLFGAGVLETIGLEKRDALLALADADRSGWISLDEAARAPRAEVHPLPEAPAIDLGSFSDADANGRPDLDLVLFVWYVDAAGERIPWARRLTDAGVAGYSFEYQLFGFGQRSTPGPGGIVSTLRAFSANAFDIHSGLPAFDPVLNDEPRHDGLARVSLAGAQQFASAVTRDRRRTRDDRGWSADDPDRDGVLEEMTSGDLDLAEWFLLNHPRPARAASIGPGEAVFADLGCAGCHVPDWKIERDRRFFDLEVAPDPATGELAGRVVPLHGEPVVVRGIYSDLRTHDLGETFHEMQFDGSKIRRFRTPPLWGAGSTAPYGHDGASLDLDAVIRRHGGEAAATAEAYRSLPPEKREAVLTFLRSLVLYSTETIPCDVDGDGKVAEHFEVAGADTGRERFNPEWLFTVPGRVEGRVKAPDGQWIESQALANVDEAYGVDLPWIADADHDGFPDRGPNDLLEVR